MTSKATKTTMFALFFALIGSAPAFAQERIRDIHTTVPADQIRTVVIEANVGEVRVRGVSDSSVTIDLTLEAKSRFSLWSGRTWGDVNGVELRTDVRGSELRITLRGERENIEEDWSITVPSRLETKVNANVGDVEITGVTGGCDAQINVGGLRIDVPEGSIRAVTNVGDVTVRTSTRSYGDVEVSANVGDARLVVNGNRINSRERRYGPGGRLSVDGSGKDRIDVRASVGDADVSIR